MDLFRGVNDPVFKKTVWDKVKPPDRLRKLTGTEHKSIDDLFAVVIVDLDEIEKPRGNRVIVALASYVTHACVFGNHFPQLLLTNKYLKVGCLKWFRSPDVNRDHWVYRLNSSKLYSLCPHVIVLSKRDPEVQAFRHLGLPDVTKKVTRDETAVYVARLWPTIERTFGKP